MNRKTATVLLVFVVLVLLWHLVLSSSMISNGPRCWDAACKQSANVDLNRFTNYVAVQVPPDSDGAPPTLSLAFNKLAAEPLAERDLNNAARRYFDVYAILLPYRVVVTEQTKDSSGDKPVAVLKSRGDLGDKPTAALNSRDDWKQTATSVDLDANTYTLADAPLTNDERTQIFQVIANFAVAQKQEEKPETLMGARVGPIGLAEDGSQQVLVRGPYEAFCGASGNCPMWIFIRSNGQLRLALEMFGNAVILRGTSSLGFRDFATASHFSAYEEYFSVYRWSGTKYDSVDCYKTTVDSNDSDRSNPPVIEDCKK
jgi:uncharacterized protein YciU (UPF0263 family)